MCILCVTLVVEQQKKQSKTIKPLNVLKFKIQFFTSNVRNDIPSIFDYINDFFLICNLVPYFKWTDKFCSKGYEIRFSDFRNKQN